LTRTCLERGRVERQLERRAGTDAPNQIVRRIFLEEAGAQIARPFGKDVGVGTVPSTVLAVTGCAILHVELLAIEICSESREREQPPPKRQRRRHWIPAHPECR